MNDLEQVQVTGAQGAAMDNALSLLTQEVWAIIALLLVGMATGMAVVGLVRIFLSRVDGDPPDVWEARRMFLTRIGAGASGLMTLWIELAYLSLILKLSILLALPTAIIAALIAAACNKPAFKPVKAIWRWALGWLKRRIEKEGGAGSAGDDLDETDFSGKKKP